MSKGLSAYQKVIAELLKEKGSLDILQISTAFFTMKLRKKGDKDASAWPYSMVDEIPQPQAVYRLMRSLEKRGLVARLLHKRPAVWYHVEWKGGKPSLPGSRIAGACSGYNHVMYRLGKVRITTKGQTWVIS